MDITSMQPPAAATLMTLDTSNIAKYRVGQQVSNMGSAGQISGVISAIIPLTPGATSGPGQIMVDGELQMVSSSSFSSAGSCGSCGEPRTAASTKFCTNCGQRL